MSPYAPCSVGSQELTERDHSTPGIMFYFWDQIMCVSISFALVK